MILLTASLCSLHSAFTSTVQEQALYHVLLCLIVPVLRNTRKQNERHSFVLQINEFDKILHSESLKQLHVANRVLIKRKSGAENYACR